MQSQDHYRVLGIERSASGAEIKTAFRRLAQRCHPDVCADPGGAARFIAVAEAYRTLRRSETRLAYDYRPPSGGMGGMAGADDTDDTDDVGDVGDVGDEGEADDEGEAVAPGIDSFDPFDLWCAFFLWPGWGWLRAH